MANTEYDLKNIHYLTKAQYKALEAAGKLEIGSEYNITDDSLIIFSDKPVAEDPKTTKLIPPMGNGGIGTLCVHAPSDDPSKTYIYICKGLEKDAEGKVTGGIWDYISSGSGSEAVIEPIVNLLTERGGHYGADGKEPLHITYYFDIQYAADKVTVTAKTAALKWNGDDQEHTIELIDYPKVIDSATELLAGLMSAQDKKDLSAAKTAGEITIDI